MLKNSIFISMVGLNAIRCVFPGISLVAYPKSYKPLF